MDDSELNLRVVQALLDRHGICADYVTSAEHAFTALKEADYDLVLMDYLMPSMNGIDAAKIIRKMTEGHDAGYYKNLPIVALTAEDNKDLIKSMLKSGINDILSKPIQPSELIRVLGKWAPTVHGIDEATLTGMLDADRESYLELIAIFCQDIDGKHTRIEKALKEKNYSEYTVEVHKIKGEAKVIGATALAEAALHLELAGKALTGTVPNDKTPEQNIALINKNTPGVLKALDTIGRELTALAQDYTSASDSMAMESITDTPSLDAVPTELLAKLQRYINHAIEALDEADISLTREWLLEIRDLINK